MISVILKLTFDDGSTQARSVCYDEKIETFKDVVNSLVQMYPNLDAIDMVV